MRNYVIINGVNSLTIQGLAIKTLPPITKPIQRNLREEIDGRDGDIVTTLGYGAYDKTIEIGLFGTFDIDEVIAYFNQKGTITFSNEADKVYYFEALDQVDYAELLKFRTANVVLHCQPFKYPLNETPLEEEYEYVEATGTNVTLDNTSEAIFNKIDLLGNTSQVSYSGQNLLPNNAITRTANGITFTKNSDGSITMNGTCTGNVDLYFVGNYDNYSDFGLTTGTYNLNGCTNGSEQTYMLFAVLRRNGNIYYYSSVNANGRVMIVETGDEFRIFIRVFNGQVLNNITIYPQINTGSTALPYIPYVGGIPSPNPNYPQDIHVVSGDNTIDICGKNLCPDNFTNGVFNNNTGLIQSHDNNHISYENYIKVLPSTQYYIKHNHNFNGTGSTSIFEYDKNKNFIQRQGFVGTNSTAFTTTATTQYINISVFDNGGASLSGFECQIEKSNQATTYEPYIGNSYPIYLGVENLLQNTATTQTINGITFIKNSDGSVLVNGTATANAILILNSFEFQGNTTYTLNGCPSSGSGSTYKLDAFGSSGLSEDIGNGVQISAGGTRNIRIVVFNGTTINNLLFKPQITKGNTSHSYTPYGKAIELCKIGTYQDYIYKENGKWYLHKEIGKVVLNGSENWSISNSGTANWYYLANISSKIITPNIPFGNSLSNYYQNNDIANGNTQIGFNILSNGTSLTNIRVRYGTEDTTTNYKKWLSTNNVIVYSPLATPTNIPIEDTTLIEQIEALKNATSYEGQTNISQENNDAPFILDLSALKENSDHLVIDNIGNIYSKPTLDLEGIGIVDIYLNDTQMFEVDLSEKNEIVIDTEKMEAYNPTDNTLANRQVTGDYSKFKLDSGENDLRFSGDLTKATITNYERWL